MYNEYLDFVENKFCECFSQKGYLHENPVAITSQIDSSVTFIGSAISTMKKYVLNKNIGIPGRYIIQNSIRTQALKNILSFNPSMFGSYFKALGALVEYQNLEKLVLDTFDYLLNYLGIPCKDIVIRINSSDSDLVKSIDKVSRDIIRQYDSFPDKYYKHKYGLEKEKIRGRNFNIGVRKKNTDIFLDIGNIIVMENDLEKLAVELALGNCTISMAYFGSNSTVESSRMSDVFKIDSTEKTKFADGVISTAVLMHEGIDIIKAHRWFEYNFKKYCRAIEFWKNQLGIEYETISKYIRNFLILEYHQDIKLTDEEMIKYLKVRK